MAVFWPSNNCLLTWSINKYALSYPIQVNNALNTSAIPVASQSKHTAIVINGLRSLNIDSGGVHILSLAVRSSFVLLYVYLYNISVLTPAAAAAAVYPLSLFGLTTYSVVCRFRLSTLSEPRCGPLSGGSPIACALTSSGDVNDAPQFLPLVDRRPSVSMLLKWGDRSTPTAARQGLISYPHCVSLVFSHQPTRRHDPNVPIRLCRPFINSSKLVPSY